MNINDNNKSNNTNDDDDVNNHNRNNDDDNNNHNDDNNENDTGTLEGQGGLQGAIADFRSEAEVETPGQLFLQSSGGATCLTNTT